MMTLEEYRELPNALRAGHRGDGRGERHRGLVDRIRFGRFRGRQSMRQRWG